MTRGKRQHAAINETPPERLESANEGLCYRGCLQAFWISTAITLPEVDASARAASVRPREGCRIALPGEVQAVQGPQPPFDVVRTA